MVDSIARITLYVEDQEKAKAFWTEKLGFCVRQEQQMGPGVKWLEIAPKENSETVFVIYDRQQMISHNPDVNVGNPSVILETSDVEKAHREMGLRGVVTGEIMHMPYGSMFHFEDGEGNTFLLRDGK